MLNETADEMMVTVEPAGQKGQSPDAAPAHSGTGSHLRHLAILLLVSLCVLLPGLSLLPLTDRDEALYVQASRQMMESHNWVDIRFQDNPRYKKPVGIYWLQGLTGLATGHGETSPLWVYRLPSLLGALLVGLFTYGIANRLSGPKAGLIAGLFAVTTVELALEARIAKTDAMLCATIVASQFALIHACLDPERKQVFWRNALFWLSLGLGILIKGPMAPLIIGLTGLGITLTERSFSLLRSLSPVRGMLAMAAVVLPWLIAIGVISGGDFFRESLGRDVLGKIATAQESHGAPPGTYLLVALGTFWPLSVFASLAFVFAWKNRREKAVQFLFYWAVPAWLVFELTATKLPNYVLPMMPALAVLSGVALTQGGLRRDTWWFRFTYFGMAAGGLILGIGLNVALYHLQGHVSFAGVALGLLVAAAGIVAWRLFLANRLMPGLAAMTVSAGLAYAMAYAVLLPQARDFWLSDRIAEAVASARTCTDPQMIVVGYAEPSIVFRLGTRTRLVDGPQAAALFSEADCAVAVVAEENSAAFQTDLARRGTPVSPTATAIGRNVNGMKLRTMQVFAKPQNAVASR
ncbi:ArnT family glycosyltransferase [Rhizobium sp. SL86]|uniref:ArnT family glycosyltransferase n=1 Tax=Rhizobium sp. SL86 TaxID=2995148 RepID=UPI0022742213|nr:glycosyltransferase family 39 protein [Rhizobium sp. SL86]MCY1668051.1 glycosyltransferase family 39 protein [Rhizobium sp. SL86]